MTITFGSREFVAATNGAVVVAYPPCSPWTDSSAIDDFSRFARVPQGQISPADAAKTYWRQDMMPKTMKRLA
jgi:hypothetical protein